MNAGRIREFYLEYIDTIYHQRRFDELGRFFSADVVPNPPLPGLPPGLPGVKAMIEAWTSSFSELQITVEDLVLDGDKLAVRNTVRAVHSGSFFGIPATGRWIEFSDHPHYRLRDGKVAEYWDVADMLTMFVQIGVIKHPLAPG